MTKVGYKQTEEHRRKHSESIMGHPNYMFHQTEEACKKISDASRGRKNPHSEETKRRISESQIGKHLSEEHKKNISKGGRGKKHALFSDETRKNISKSHRGVLKTEETRKKMSISRQKRKKELGYINSVETRKKSSEKQTALWQDSEYKEKQIRAVLKSLRKRPTSYEKKIIDLCKKYNLPFKYVGNGEVIIAGKNPDFIECNGRKLLIEPHCRLVWYETDYEKRADIFAKYGYKTLFLYDENFVCKNWEEVCLEKIKKFIQENEEGVEE